MYRDVARRARRRGRHTNFLFFIKKLSERDYKNCRAFLKKHQDDYKNVCIKSMISRVAR